MNRLERAVQRILVADALKQQLSSIKVYMVGDEAEWEVYILGTTAD
jgi:hypothetical protein